MTTLLIPTHTCCRTQPGRIELIAAAIRKLWVHGFMFFQINRPICFFYCHASHSVCLTVAICLVPIEWTAVIGDVSELINLYKERPWLYNTTSNN